LAQARNTAHAFPANVAEFARPELGWRQIEGSLNHVMLLTGVEKSE
jgi:hypothetical protein